MTQETLTIRNASLQDIDQIADIERICFPEAEAAKKAAMEMRLKAYEKGFFVGLIDDHIIGFVNGGAFDADTIDDAFFESMDAHNDDNRSLVIFGLDVLPEYQNKGYAAQLMKAFIAFGKQEKKEKILLTCKSHLIHYYEKFGYENDGVSESVHGGAQWYDMTLYL